MKKIVLFLTYMCLLGFCSCIVDDTPDRSFEELPELTTTGEGMLAFKHGSESYVKENGLDNVFYQLSDEGPILVISADWEDREINGVTLAIWGFELEDGLEVNFSSRIPQSAYYSFFYERQNDGEFIDSNEQSLGSISISFFDSDSNIVSGTFSTEFTHPFTAETIKITEGRFDTFFRR